MTRKEAVMALKRAEMIDRSFPEEEKFHFCFYEKYHNATLIDHEGWSHEEIVVVVLHGKKKLTPLKVISEPEVLEVYAKNNTSPKKFFFVYQLEGWCQENYDEETKLKYYRAKAVMREHDKFFL